MSRNNAQQAASQVTKTRESIFKQGQRKGLAEAVRKDLKKDADRGKGHDAQSKEAQKARDETFRREYLRAKATPVGNSGYTLFC